MEPSTTSRFNCGVSLCATRNCGLGQTMTGVRKKTQEPAKILIILSIDSKRPAEMGHTSDRVIPPMMKTKMRFPLILGSLTAVLRTESLPTTKCRLDNAQACFDTVILEHRSMVTFRSLIT